MSITLVTVGNFQHSLMKFAVEKTVQNVPVDKIKIFSDVDIGVDNSETIILPEGFNREDYSIFMLKELHNHIDTDHVLVIQYDGFATHGEFWNEKFLQYDYCGTTTYYKHPPLYSSIDDNIRNNVVDKWVSLGGGFSLRSKKMLEALSDDRIDPWIHSGDGKFLCEDISIGIIYKKLLEEDFGIKFCSIEDSVEFGAEILSAYPFCLGFHGWEQLPYFLDEEECLFYVSNYLNNVGLRESDATRWIKLIGFCYAQRYRQVLTYLANVPLLRQIMISV